MWDLIFNKLDFLSKIKFRQINSYSMNLNIYDFKNINKKYLQKLNDDVLINYSFIKYLNARNNKKITNINHMSNLKILDASHCC